MIKKILIILTIYCFKINKCSVFIYCLWGGQANKNTKIDNVLPHFLFSFNNNFLNNNFNN